MKKYVLLSVLVFGFLSLISLANAVSPTPTTILSENFGTGSSTFSTSPWSNGGNSGEDAEFRAPSSGNDSASPDGGRFAVMLGTNGYICRTINATGYENLTLEYYWRGDSDANSNDYGIVEYKTSTDNCSGSFTNLQTHNIDNHSSWSTQSTFSLPGSLANTSFKLKFRVNSTQNDEHFRVDGIVVKGTPVTPPDTTAPTTSVTYPIHNALISGSIEVTADASDTDSGVSKVEFWHATTDTKIGEDTEAPYSITWDTTNILEGNHSVWVVAYDNAGNHTVSEVIPVKVDNTKPVITLLEDPEISIYVGMDYPFAGATAQDDIDGDITSKIVVDNQVNNLIIGSYEIAYNVTDTAGNKADEVIRKVNVVARRRTQTTTTTTTTTTENTGTNTEEIPANTNPQGEVLGENTGNNNTENTNPVVTEETPVGEVLGEATFKFTKFMKIGSRNEEVSELQKRLTQEGVYTGPITGYFGKLTDKAVKEYQTKNPPLKVDGIVGPKTRAVLNGEI